MGALINLDIAADNEGEFGSQFIINKEFGQHRARMDLSILSKGYNPNQSTSLVNTFSNRYNIEGPSPIKIGDNLRYSANYRYDKDSEGETSQTGFFGLNTQFKRIGVNQAFDYSKTLL